MSDEYTKDAATLTDDLDDDDVAVDPKRPATAAAQNPLAGASSAAGPKPAASKIPWL
jgi:hypothetical protein